MGMAASQARYLSLVARKSNCELEGQQINQARTALSNQSANLFNQMLGLEVPIPPSTQDFTKVQYSFTDGINGSVVSNWYQLTEADPDYNYVVTHHYFTDRYTGSMKKLTDPQIQFTGGSLPTNNADIKAKLDAIAVAEDKLEQTEKKILEKQAEIESLSSYTQKGDFSSVSNATLNPDRTYTVTNGGTPTTFYPMDDSTTLRPTDVADVTATIKSLMTAGALSGDPLNTNDVDLHLNSILYDPTTKSIAFKSDLNSLIGMGSGTNTILSYYRVDTAATPTDATSVQAIINKLNDELTQLNLDRLSDATALTTAKKAYEALQVPTHIGNCELIPLSTLTKEQETELKQVIADMEAQGINTALAGCFDGDGNYIGGAYQFQLNGQTYFTTYEDMLEVYKTETVSNNDIDGQVKMTYYNASYVSTKIETTEKALIETDDEGRFASIRFENDTITYPLNMEEITDEAAYKDAMNKYNYENAKYDNAIREINAKTSIIQQQDQQLELRLKQLDTEQKALSTEMEAVKKIVTDNIEASFKTFGG